MLKHGDLSDEWKQHIENKLPISTLERLIATPTVRSATGFNVRDNKPETELPADEVLKPLQRFTIPPCCSFGLP